MIHGDTHFRDDKSRPAINLLEPLHTAAKLARQRAGTIAEPLPPLRFQVEDRFPTDAAPAAQRQAGQGDPLHAFLTASLDDPEDRAAPVPAPDPVAVLVDAVEPSADQLPTNDLDGGAIETASLRPDDEAADAAPSAAAHTQTNPNDGEAADTDSLDPGEELTDAVPTTAAAFQDEESANGPSPTSEASTPTSPSESTAAAADRQPATAVATAEDFDPETGNEDWRDETPGTHFGETQPEDELPLLDTRTALSAAVQRGFPGAQLASASETWPDTSRLDRMADRLEEIARSLRQHEAAGSLIAQARDPLGALITGYLLGYFEGQETREPDSSG